LHHLARIQDARAFFTQNALQHGGLYKGVPVWGQKDKFNIPEISHFWIIFNGQDIERRSLI